VTQDRFQSRIVILPVVGTVAPHFTVVEELGALAQGRRAGDAGGRLPVLQFEWGTRVRRRHYA
jgi:hypothetical protein